MVHFPFMIPTVQGHLAWVKIKCFQQSRDGEWMHWENSIPLYRQDIYYFTARTVFL